MLKRFIRVMRISTMTLAIWCALAPNAAGWAINDPSITSQKRQQLAVILVLMLFPLSFWEARYRRRNSRRSSVHHDDASNNYAPQDVNLLIHASIPMLVFQDAYQSVPQLFSNIAFNKLFGQCVRDKRSLARWRFKTFPESGTRRLIKKKPIKVSA